jgi:hypothetical protein
MSKPTQILKLPPGFDEYEQPDSRPRRVSSKHVKVWLGFWWGGINADSYLRTLVKTGQLTPVDAPFGHKLMFDTDAVLVWAMKSGAAEVVR